MYFREVIAYSRFLLLYEVEKNNSIFKVSSPEASTQPQVQASLSPSVGVFLFHRGQEQFEVL